jgi:flagellar hook-associated protein 3 FlgL
MTLRVTNQSLAQQVNEGLQQAFRRLAKVQEQVTTGKRINRLSDEPIDAVRILDLRSFGESLSQNERNINAGLPFLQQSDTILAEVEKILGRAQELALAMVNDTNGPTERQAAATEVGQLSQQLLSLANTRVENRFIFGGFKNGSAPFSEAGGAVQYNGDNGEIAIQGNASTQITLNLLGNEVFQGAGVPGGVGLFDVLRDLESVLRSAAPVHQLNLAVNLDDAAAAPAAPFPAGPDDTPANWLAASNFSSGVTVFDSLGEAHDLTFLFRKATATSWDYRVVAKRKELDATAPASTDLREVGAGTLVFTGAGALDAPASTINGIGPLAWTNGAAAQSIAAADLAFAGSTQSTASSAVLTLAQTDTNGFNPQISRLEAALNQVLSFRAELGARLNTVQAVQDGLTLLQTQTADLRSQIEDADVLKIYSDFTRLQQAFQAALQSTSRIIQPTLLDFLR